MEISDKVAGHELIVDGGLLCNDHQCQCPGTEILIGHGSFEVADLVAVVAKHRRANGLDGTTPSGWEGHTEAGIPVIAFITLRMIL